MTRCPVYRRFSSATPEPHSVASIVVGSLSYTPVFTNMASAITPPAATKNGATTPYDSVVPQ